MNLNFYKKEHKFRTKTKAPDPDLYWQIIVIVAFVFIIFAFVFGYILFNSVKEEGNNLTESTITKQPVGEERIKKVIDYLETKENKSMEIISSPSPVVDPSI